MVNWDRNINGFHLLPDLHSPTPQGFSIANVPTLQEPEPSHTSSGGGLATKTATKVLKSKTTALNHPAIKNVGIGIKAFHVGEIYKNNYQNAIANGHPPHQAAFCETLNTATDVSITTALQVPVTAVAAGGVFALGAYSLQNPAAAPFTRNVIDGTLETYKATSQIGQTTGKVVQKGCYDAFNAADAW